MQCTCATGNILVSYFTLKLCVFTCIFQFTRKVTFAQMSVTTMGTHMINLSLCRLDWQWEDSLGQETLQGNIPHPQRHPIHTHTPTVLIIPFVPVQFLILIGLTGSGKTAWAKRHCKEIPRTQTHPHAHTHTAYNTIIPLQVIMMIGLTGSGKTTWAKRHRKENPEKHYVILGTNQIIEETKVGKSVEGHHYRCTDRFKDIF